MDHRFNLIALVILLLCLPSFAQIHKAGILKRGIICLTYDDGLETQLSTAVPQLDSLGLKATFFLNSIQGSSQSDIIGQSPEEVLGWSKVAKNGHELANHTLFHPCPEKLGWSNSMSIENYTIDRILKEITAENIILSLLDPTRKKRAFAFPCNNFLIGDLDYSKIIKDKNLVTFGRAGGDSTSVVVDFKQLNPMKVPSWHVWTGTTLKELIAFAEKVKKKGGMGVYQFHGVGGQIFAISKETHKSFLTYLKLHTDEYWVSTFSEAMEHILK